MARCNGFNAAKAKRAQELLKSMLILEDLEYRKPRILAGVDVSYSGGLGHAVVVAVEGSTRRIVSCWVYTGEVCVPYIPGLLAFREMQVIAPALSRLLEDVEPDVIVVDGHGIAHPRRFGIASHIGVVFLRPTIGVAKRRLYGRETLEGRLEDEEGNLLGYIVKSGRRKLYVSPGNMLSHETARNIIEEVIASPGQLPYPTHVADKITKQVKKTSRMGLRRCGLLTGYGIG